MEELAGGSQVFGYKGYPRDFKRNLPRQVGANTIVAFAFAERPMTFINLATCEKW
jgi:hypothetical protein